MYQSACMHEACQRLTFPPKTHTYTHTCRGYHAPQEKSLSAQRFVLVTRPQWHVASCKIFGQGGQAPGIQASTSNRQWMGTQKEETEGGREKREEGHTYTSTDKHRHTHTHTRTRTHTTGIQPGWHSKWQVWPQSGLRRRPHGSPHECGVPQGSKGGSRTLPQKHKYDVGVSFWSYTSLHFGLQAQNRM